MWLAGYGSRNHPAEGKEQDLYVKAVALEDRAGHKLVLMTSDLVGIPRELSEQVAADVQRRTSLPRERLMLTCSHTHCAISRESVSFMSWLTRSRGFGVPLPPSVEGSAHL